ncbi:MAG TPA: sulfatase-like hydrolase/transferase, partial [Vicinamibacterales bacterium]
MTQSARAARGRAPARRLFGAAVVVFVLVGTGVAAWRFIPRAARSATGVDLGRPTAPSGPLNLVIVTLDTTRADRMGAYGNKDIETPAFDRIAHEGVLFEQAV